MTPAGLSVRVHDEPSEPVRFWAEVLDLPGCFASGCTIDELLEALADAIRLCQREDERYG